MSTKPLRMPGGAAACARALVIELVVPMAIALGLAPGHARAAEPPDRAASAPEIDNDTVNAMVAGTLAQTARYQLELSRRGVPGATPLQASRRQAVPLQLALSGVPEGYDVYGLVMAAQDECLVAERISRRVAKSTSLMRSLNAKTARFSWSDAGTLQDKAGQPMVKMGHLRLQGAEITIAGLPGAGALSTVGFGSRAYPMNIAFGVESISNAMFTMLDPDATPEKLKQFKVDNEDFPLLLNFAYLASASGQARETLADLQLELTAPDAPLHYNGVVVWPVLVKRFANGLVVVRIDDHHSNRLVLPAEPAAGTRPIPCEADVQTTATPTPEPAADPGRLTLAALDPPPLRVGREASVEFRADFAALGPDTEVYVVLQPADGNNVLSSSGGVNISAGATSVRMRACNDPQLQAGELRIQPDPIVIAAPPLVGGRLEAGKLGSVAAGGQGVLRGRVRFTPPPLNRYYDRMRATPVALSWSKDGRLCTTLSTEARSYVELRLEGR